MYPKWLFVIVLKFCSTEFFYMVRQSYKLTLQTIFGIKKIEKKKGGAGLQERLFLISNSSLPRFHENASVLRCIFDIFNNYGLKSGQKNSGEAVLSRSPSYNKK